MFNRYQRPRLLKSPRTRLTIRAVYNARLDYALLDELLAEEGFAPITPEFNAPTVGAMNDILRRIEAEKCKRSFAYFFKAGWHVVNRKVRLIWNWHIQVVCDHVEAVFRELFKARNDESYVMKAQNLLINVPPRSAKSLIVSVYAPAWAWLHDPSLKIASRSATSDVVNRDAGFFRDVVGSPWYQDLFTPDWQIGGKSDSDKPLADGVKKYENTMGGFRVSASMMAKAVGTGADISIIDDPHDPEDADSDVKRKGQVSKYQNSLHNRVEDGLRCCRIVIMQRLHEMDLSGYLESQNGLKVARYLRERPAANENEATNGILGEDYGGWCHVVIPQLYEVNHPCKPHFVNVFGWRDPRREDGELLFPKRFTKGLIKQYREDLKEYGFAGQHQQRPAPAGGGLFKRINWRFYHRANHEDRPTAPVARPDHCITVEKCPPIILPRKMDFIHVSIDAAFKDKETGSAVGALVMGYKGPNVYYLEDRTKTIGYAATKKLVKELAEKYPFAAILLEDKANGSAVENELRDDIPGLIMVNPQGGKIARANMMTASFQGCNHFLEEGAAWTHDLVHEFGVFPNGRRDDRVDSASQSYTHKVVEGSDMDYARTMMS